MGGNITIRSARLVLPSRVVTGDLRIQDGMITEIGPHLSGSMGDEIDAKGLTLLPGVIDMHVHFRDPGFPDKEDLRSGSMAAAAGGVTSFIDMPNTSPLTTTAQALHHKLDLAAEKSVINYGFFMAATGDNLDELTKTERSAGVQVFMGVGANGDTCDATAALLNDPVRIEQLFENVNQLIAVHPTDSKRVRERQSLYLDSDNAANHPIIRDVKSVLHGTELAVRLAQKFGNRLHVQHISCAEEAAFMASITNPRISCEVTPAHLFLHAEEAYEHLGTRAQNNPPIRERRHSQALQRALLQGSINAIASDHAPHTVAEKERPYTCSPAGVPGVEWSLPLMLDFAKQGQCTLPQLSHWLSEVPARILRLARKGRLEVGFDADMVLVNLDETRTVGEGPIWTRAGWSPYLGRSIQGWPVMTFVAGRPVFQNGTILPNSHGRELTYSGRALSP